MNDNDLLAEVYRRTSIRRRRRVRLATTIGGFVVVSIVAVAIIVRVQDPDPQAVIAGPGSDPSPTLTLTVSNPAPNIGEEVVITVRERGGMIAYPALIFTGDPRQSTGGAAGPLYPCGTESDDEARTTEYRWTYTAPGEYQIRASQRVGDPCDPDSFVTLEQELTITVSD